MSEANEHIDQAFHGGASGYVAKTINPLDLPSTIRQVVEGTVFTPRGRAGEGGAAPAGTGTGHPGGLTDRELSIPAARRRGPRTSTSPASSTSPSRR